MLKAKHLLHPLRTAAIAKGHLALRLNVMRLAHQGERRYGHDPRYSLQSVADGFASRLKEQSDDTELLKRICTAYIKSVEQERFASDRYKATQWWEQVRRKSLGAATRALATSDIDALRKMYRNFFRDPCIAGLSGMPLRIVKQCFGKKISKVHGHLFLSDALHRLDYWQKQTGNRFVLEELSCPETGNPFGVMIEGRLVRTGSEYQHYCAQRIIELFAAQTAAVAEIGGGFGGMAHYLMRDHSGVTYLDFDVPESIALASYYLIKSLPERRFLLYGEAELTEETIRQFDGILMPVFELAKVPAGSINLAFSSHTMSDISEAAMTEYVDQIARMTRSCFWCVDHYAATQSMNNIIKERCPSLYLSETLPSSWNSYRFSSGRETEFLYRVGNS